MFAKFRFAKQTQIEFRFPTLVTTAKSLQLILSEDQTINQTITGTIRNQMMTTGPTEVGEAISTMTTRTTIGNEALDHFRCDMIVL